MVNMIKMRSKFREQQKKLDAKAPKAGDIAPDFELLDPSGQDSVRLSDFRGKKPVALSFGSYT
jgi:peroxiredoxin